MPIQVLTLAQLRKVTNTSAEQLRSDRFRDQGVAAFGASDWVLPGRPLAIDAVAIAVRDELAKVLPRKTASVITRGWFDKWIEGVARVEHNNEQIVFVVAQLTSGDEWRCALGPAPKLVEHIAQLPRWKVCVAVDIGDIMRTIRERATKARIDLSGSFFLPIDDLRAQQLIGEFREARERAGFKPKKPLAVQITSAMRDKIAALAAPAARH
jgi:hypothetical protein